MRSVTGDRIRKYLEKGSEYLKHFFISLNPHNILGGRDFSKIPILQTRKQRLSEVSDSKWSTQKWSLTNERT